MNMATRRYSDVRRRRFTPEQIARQDRWAEKEILRMSLQEIRKASGKTQSEVAAAARMTQGNLSKAERGTDHLVSTLRTIVQALGGDLEIRAVFKDHSVRLQ